MLHVIEANTETNKTLSVANVTTESEARPKFWYVAYVRCCCEKKATQKMDAQL